MHLVLQCSALCPFGDNAKELDFGRALTLDQLAVYSQGAQGVALVDCTIGVLSRM